MRVLDFFTVLAPLAGIFAVVFRLAGLRMIRAFTTVGALAPDRAIAPPTQLFSTFWRQRLEAAGVLRAAGSGTYWLDRAALRALNAARRKRVFIILAALAVLMLARTLSGA